MESPRKNNDCYFYYYSTCTKGDSCTFRHEPSALGCETVCSFWKEGKCLNVHCSFRHMELRKNRKAIPCYWETQPGGCLKPHCPFLHKSPKDGMPENLEHTELSSDLSKPLGQSSSQVSENDRKANQFSETNFGNPTVDPLVVNFEEESDNESAPTNSPAKSNQTRVVKVKTLEEIRLEKIQAESAAYYFYPGVEEAVITNPVEVEVEDDLRTRLTKKPSIKLHMPPSHYGVLSLEEIRQRRKRNLDVDDHDHEDDENGEPKVKQQKYLFQKNNKPQDFDRIKVKTLAEIRAEKNCKNSDESKEVPTTCSEVSSTSNTEEITDTPEVSDEINVPAKCQKRRVSSTSDHIAKKPKLKRTKLGEYLEITSSEKIITRPEDDCIEETPLRTEEEGLDEKQIYESENIEKQNITLQLNNQHTASCDNNKNSELKRDSSKLDDILLLDDEDIEETSINLKEEEDILNDIDNLLNV